MANKKSKIGIVLAILGAILAFAAVFFVTLLILKSRFDPQENHSTEAPTASESESESEPESESETEPPTETETEAPTESEEEVIDRRDLPRIWIGDSRMVGLERSNAGRSDKDIFIAKGAMYFEWFRDEALVVLAPYLENNARVNVIIQMGVNDSANNTKGWLAYTISDYIALLNDLVDRYPYARFYFMSVGRTVGNYRGTTVVKPKQITPAINEFNVRMQNDCKAIYLATGEYIYANNLGYADGVHYNNATNRALYDYVVERLNLEVSEYFEPYP